VDDIFRFLTAAKNQAIYARKKRKEEKKISLLKTGYTETL